VPSHLLTSGALAGGRVRFPALFFFSIFPASASQKPASPLGLRYKRPALFTPFFLTFSLVPPPGFADLFHFFVFLTVWRFLFFRFSPASFFPLFCARDTVFTPPGLLFFWVVCRFQGPFISPLPNGLGRSRHRCHDFFPFPAGVFLLGRFLFLTPPCRRGAASSPPPWTHLSPRLCLVGALFCLVFCLPSCLRGTPRYFRPLVIEYGQCLTFFCLFAPFQCWWRLDLPSPPLVFSYALRLFLFLRNPAGSIPPWFPKLLGRISSFLPFPSPFFLQFYFQMK